MIDTMPVRKSSHREPRASTTSGRDQARYLVAEYLHDWGLRDPDIIADESRRIVDHAETLIRSVTPVSAEILDRDLATRSLEIAMEEVESSIAAMAASSIREPLLGIPTSNSIVPRMAGVLLEFPDAIRHRDRPPARLLQVLERSVAPIIPRSHHREMPAQPSTRLCSLFRGCYWLELYGRFQTWVFRSVGVS